MLRGNKKHSKLTPSLSANPILAQFLRMFDKKFANTKLNYRPAVLKIAGPTALRPNDFFIEWYFRSGIAENMQRYRNRFDLNRIEDLALRRKVAEVMIQAINESLEAGLNPADELTVKNYQEYNNIKAVVKTALKEICQPLNNRKTVSTYKAQAELFFTFLKKQQLEKINITDFTKKHALLYQRHLMDQAQSNRTINTKLQLVQNLFKQLVNTDTIASNPFSVIKPLKVLKNEPEVYSVKEIETIKKQLSKESPELWIFAAFVYYCFMRPASITQVQVKHIDFKNRMLLVPAGNHKNAKYSYKQLLRPIFELLLSYRDLSPETYIFSFGLKPGAKSCNPKRASELWRKIVKDGLQIDKDMYLLKDTGGAHYLQNNRGQEALKWLQMQMGHADLQTTSIYTNKMQQLTIDESNSVILDF